MDSKQIFFMGGWHLSLTNNWIEYEEIKPEKVVKVKKGKCDFCGRSKTQTFTK